MRRRRRGERGRGTDRTSLIVLKWNEGLLPCFFLLSPLAFAFAFALQVSGLPLASTDITQSWSHGPFIRVVGLSPSLVINSSLSLSLLAHSLLTHSCVLFYFFSFVFLYLSHKRSLYLSLSHAHTLTQSHSHFCVQPCLFLFLLWTFFGPRQKY